MSLSPRGNAAPPGVVTAQGTEGGGGLPLSTDQPDREPLPSRAVRLARRHALFGAVLLAAAAVRVIAMLGFRGPMLYPDSTGYVADAVHMAPGLIRPSGYPAMLRLLEPFHSLAGVLGVQHAMGLGMGVAGYALLRRAGLPGWGATLAMVPVLLSAYAIQIEHFLVSDTLLAFLVMMAVAAMMWWPDPPVWACGLAGLLLAAATLVRSQGIPLAGYAAWFDSVQGTFRLAASDGAYLYSGVTTFADCAKINPPPAERRLCLNVPVSEREWPGFYIWSSTSPIQAVPGGAFGKRADSLGTSFALRAIRAQPLDYLRVAGRSFWENFLLEPSTHAGTIVQRVWAESQNGYTFPAAPRKLPP